MNLKSYKTSIFKESDALTPFILKHIKKIKEGSVLVISSKIVALSEGRTLPPMTQKEFGALVKEQSDYALKTKLCYFTISRGMVMTNAGVDVSNSAGGKTILLPRDAYGAARALRTQLCKAYKIKQLGIIIADSMILPLRAGVIGAAIGYAGFEGVKNFIGHKDIYGRKLKTTYVNCADALAAAATILMGEADERRPLCVIDAAPVKFTSKNKIDEIKYPLKQDLYYPFLKGKIK